MSRWVWRFCLGATACSGLLALGLLMLPVLLVLLMVLFDTTAQALMVLLGLIARWLQALLPAGADTLPPYRAIALNPISVAAGALARALPCVTGLVLIVIRPEPGRHWWWIVALWSVATFVGGKAVAVTLLPGLAIAIGLAWPFAWQRTG